MFTPSPPKSTTRFPTAHALKLQREGSTIPPTVSFLQAAASRVVNSLANLPQPSLLAPGTASNTRLSPQEDVFVWHMGLYIARSDWQKKEKPEVLE
ncbi:hypothetical protein H5410_035929 [Solanum commersonii]|uniref:Uncharacterized protein n=1 Tax=Solanum commersonii TaxID=4109 RepID=A0A9J5Y2N8_SOLCO|nr:hypothetical protein H5410_035929 [Solanum commersonii]